MNREIIENELSKIEEEIQRTQQGTEEYKKLTESYDKLNNALMNDIRTENDRIEKNMTYDLRREELEYKILDSEQKVKASKFSDIMGVIGKIVSIGGMVLGMWLLDETKEKQGFIDKDKIKLAFNFAPRG